MRDRLQKLEVFQGDMLQDRGILVIPVNCVPGVMGAGLAKQFAGLCPAAKKNHEFAVRTFALGIGNPRLCYGIHHDPFVMFPTKKHWRDPSRLQWIKDGLDALAIILKREISLYPNAETMMPFIGVGAIIMPALGCGLGGLGYGDVYPLIANFANSLPEPYHVRLYRPHNSND